jgi:hypothetical protein
MRKMRLERTAAHRLGERSPVLPLDPRDPAIVAAKRLLRTTDRSPLTVRQNRR